MTSADVAVRPARLLDAVAIAEIQAKSWTERYHAILPELPSVAELSESWHAALRNPPTPNHRVVLATSAGQPVGFCAFGPSLDPEGGEIFSLSVLPNYERQGHGSRLLAAVVADLQPLGLRRLLLWLPEGDQPRQLFLAAAGLQADGSRRHLAEGTHLLWEARWSAEIADETPHTEDPAAPTG